MTAAEAKRISIVSIMRYLYALYPKTEGEREVWFFSPLREESTPSFKVDQGKNVFFDHGEGWGGTPIDLVCRLSNCSVAEALQKISALSSDPGAVIVQSSSFSPAKRDEEPKTKITKITELSSGQLNYVRSRGITDLIARKYLKSVHYTNDSDGKNFYNIGFVNDSGGYDVRSSFFKGCVGKKDISTIRGVDATKVSVFEGFFDFLAALVFFGVEAFKGDVIILNSISQIKKINLHSYQSIYLFLDNDKAGDGATSELIREYGEKCHDCRHYYQNHKDFNEQILPR